MSRRRRTDPRPALGGVALLVLAGCDEVPHHLRVVGGDPDLGRELVIAYGCPACHQLPEIGTVQGSVGPSLAGFGRRGYIAGRLPNRPEMLTAWLRNPPAIDPQTAMPSLGVGEAEARHMAAFLYTLR
ncbi:MAG: c-type cytochrome [Pseudomonadota bacterium]|nr:c-type cytochrome [Pseudomonadota bacterium]